MLTHVALACLVAAGSTAGIRVPANSGSSTINATICNTNPSTKCDSDSSPMTGYIEVEFDSRSNPTKIVLEDFNLVANNAMHFDLDYGFLVGHLYVDTNVNNDKFRVAMAEPGARHPHFGMSGSSFTVQQVPYYKLGQLSYEATMLLCTGLQSSGLPCSDTRNLADEDVAIFNTVSGTATISGNTLTLTATVNISQTMDSLSLNGTATFNGSVTIPQVADLTGDGFVDQEDFGKLQACISGPYIAQNNPECTMAKLDFDEDVDQDDVRIFEGCLAGAKVVANVDCATHLPPQ